MYNNIIEQQREHFDSIANRYRLARQNFRHQLLKKEIWDKALENVHFPEKNTLRVLDAMCGYLDGYQILSSHTTCALDYHAFDYSGAVVECSLKNFPQLRVWQEDVTKYRSDQQYDVIIVLGGLHHVHAHASNVVERLGESLSPSGLFISLEPTHDNLFFRFVREHIYKKNILFDENSERAFSTTELDSMFFKSGLHPISKIYPGLLAYVLWYNPDAFPLLNRGSRCVVKGILKLEKWLWKTELARMLSFATLSIYQKDGPSGFSVGSSDQGL
jgi:SAM-dependent methyltransferase